MFCVLVDVELLACSLIGILGCNLELHHKGEEVYIYQHLHLGLDCLSL